MLKGVFGWFLIDGLAAIRYLTGLLAVPFYLLAGVRLYKLGRPDRGADRVVYRA